MLTTAIAILAAVALLLPGFIVTEIAIARGARSSRSDLELALRALSYALVIHLIFGSWTADLVKRVGPVGNWADHVEALSLYALVVLVAVPVLGINLNFLLARVERRDGPPPLWAAALGAGQARDAYDFAFQRFSDEGAWVIVELVGHTALEPRLVGDVTDVRRPLARHPQRMTSTLSSCVWSKWARMVCGTWDSQPIHREASTSPLRKSRVWKFCPQGPIPCSHEQRSHPAPPASRGCAERAEDSTPASANEASAARNRGGTEEWFEARLQRAWVDAPSRSALLMRRRHRRPRRRRRSRRHPPTWCRSSPRISRATRRSSPQRARDEQAARAERGADTIKATVNRALRQVGGDHGSRVKECLDVLARADLARREEAWR